MKNYPSPRNFLRWFDLRSRHLSYWAFILNRVTALGLVLYLFLHLIVLGTLARGPAAYDAFITFAKQPVVLFGELLVVAAGIIHGLNGIRVGMTSLGVGVTRQRSMFIVLMVIAAVSIGAFALRMFSAH